MKTIVFDFGNVIGFFDHQQAVRNLLPFTSRSAEDLTHILYETSLESDYEIGAISTPDFATTAMTLGEIHCSPEQFLEAYSDIFRRNDAVCELIPRLKPRYRLVLASNTNDAHYRRYTRMFADVLAHFDQLCPSHLAGSRKPSAEYFAYCQPFTQAEPGECLFIDDVPENVESAQRHGWNVVLHQASDDLASQLRAAGVESA